jgi:hypothetical protein
VTTQTKPEPVGTSEAAPTPPPEVVSGDILTLLLFGPPGVGKTHLAGTAADDPRCTPVLFIDLEGGAMTVDWRPAAGQKMRILGPAEAAGNLLAIAELVRSGEALFAPTGEPYRTVILDSMTEESWSIQDEMRGRAKRGVKDPNPNKLDWTEWDEYTTIVRDVLRAFLESAKLGRINFIVTMLDSEVNGVHVPQMKGKGAREMLPALFNTVARLSLEKSASATGEIAPIRRLQLQQTYDVQAKDRSDRLGTMPKTMDDPTIGRLVDRIAEGRRRAVAAAKTAQKNT